MKGEHGKFGSDRFTRREQVFLRLHQLENLAGQSWMRFRYRHRISFGKGCQADHRTLHHRGLGVVEFGEEVIIERGIHKVSFRLEQGSRVSLGRGTWIQTHDGHTVFSCKPGARIAVGGRCWFSGGIFGASREIVVGDHTLIGWGCMVLDSPLHRMDNDSPEPEPEPVFIGSHVWMPSYITVLKGVTIGDHCVIGTGSLVAEDIPPRSFAAGRPARVIKKIGDRDLVE